MSTTTPGVVVPIDVLLNDFDADHDPLAIVSFTQGASGTVTDSVIPGRLNYTPTEPGSYLDAFTYTITDGRDGFATGVVTVTVNGNSGGGEGDAAST